MNQWVGKNHIGGVADTVWATAGGIFAICAALWLVTDVRDYIDVSAIEVRDTPQGQPIEIDVARVLSGQWAGFYSVEMRDAETGAQVCYTGKMPVNYSEYAPVLDVLGFPIMDANGDPQIKRTELPRPTYMSFWADGGTCTGALKRGLPVGLYSQKTCHIVKYPMGFLPVSKGECWPVTTFRITERQTS